MAKYDEYANGFYITHLIVPTGRIFYNRGPVEEQFPQITCDVQIGVDESTKQTGICIADMKGNPLMLIDLINIALPKAEVYLTLLRRWVNKTLPKMKVKRIIYEEINQNAPQQYARRRLMQVANIFETYVDECEDNIEITCINNKTWKKHLLADDKYKGQRTKTDLVKSAVQNAVAEWIPVVNLYRSVYYNGDSCDATGIIYGYAKECFVDSNCRNMKVNSTLKSTPLRSYNKYYCELNELIDKVKRGETSLTGYKKLCYNPDMTLEDNCLRAINYNPKGVILWNLNHKNITANTVIIVKYSGSKKQL
jgi:hypothetical protein